MDLLVSSLLVLGASRSRTLPRPIRSQKAAKAAMPLRKKRKAAPTPVESIRHKDKRKNIPTEELRDFVAEDEQAPEDDALSARPVARSAAGLERQRRAGPADLAVPVVPIYIQEKIHPQAIIDDLCRSDGEDAGEQDGRAQTTLSPTSTACPTTSTSRSTSTTTSGHWSNRMILGDSLLVMTSLAEKEGLKGKVQTIYLDPPYGIKFGSNWQVSTRKRDVKDGKAEDATRQPEQVRAFRDTWKLGIHSYLAYLRDRLVVARELLTETGSVFVQIGDENVHLVRSVMDEVFGSENFVALITFERQLVERAELACLNHATTLLWYAQESSSR